MDKLKKIVNQLNTDQFDDFSGLLKSNSSVKFLTLLLAYNNQQHDDEEIKTKLNCSNNSYFVLKSRLYDKIQQFLLKKETATASGLSINGSESIIHFLYEYPPEKAIALLQELENKFIAKESPGDLITVYSTLKKAHFYSEKYYTYSQLYNNQMAYVIALEKAEETISNFNRSLANYYFSLSDNDKDLLKLLKKELVNLFSLYKSPRIELLLNIVSIHLLIFTDIEDNESPPIEDLLAACEIIFEKYVTDKRMGYYRPAVLFLQFEYYLKINQLKKAQVYFDAIMQNQETWLLQNKNCLAFKFLLSKINMLLHLNRKDEIGTDVDEMLMDQNDLYTVVIHKFYKGIALFFDGKIKDAISTLNDLLNEVSFTNFGNIETEIKLTLAYYYIVQKEFELAENVLKSITRKLKNIALPIQNKIKEALKLFNILVRGIDDRANQIKYQKSLEQFKLYNSDDNKLITHLLQELNLLVRK